MPAIAALWVTTTVVEPTSRLARVIAVRTSLPVSTSRAPVGSSQKQRVGTFDNRPGDRDPLLLASGELGREVAEPISETHHGKGVFGAHGVGRDLGYKLDVLAGR